MRTRIKALALATLLGAIPAFTGTVQALEPQERGRQQQSRQPVTPPRPAVGQMRPNVNRPAQTSVAPSTVRRPQRSFTTVNPGRVDGSRRPEVAFHDRQFNRHQTQHHHFHRGVWWFWRTPGIAVWDPLYWGGVSSGYVNPYYAPSGFATSSFNYEQPIPGTSTATTDERITADEQQAMTFFDQARQAFKSKNYQRALDLTERAIKMSPSDEVLHEFRALTLFAMKRYDDAATVLYAVLVAGPGWNWDTVQELYGNPDTYTQQLRALEDAYRKTPNSPRINLLLAYQYLMLGHPDAAEGRLEVVVNLNQNDTLAKGLLQALERQGANLTDGETRY